MQFLEFLFVPTILFMVLVLPIWLVLHYGAKKKMGRGLTESDQESLDQLLRQLDEATARIETLESILDAKNPNWKSDIDS